MNTRRFGRLEWPVSEIGYGMWGMGSWSGSDDEASMLSLQRAANLGCNFFDTAYAYGEGRSEALLGRLIRANPASQLFTATKIPPKNKQWPSRRGVPLGDVFPRDHILSFVDKSLENAGIEQFDLVQFHVWEDEWAEENEWIDAIGELREDGKLQGVGISINRWEPTNGIRTVESGNIDSVQVIYNIFDQSPEDELFPACREHDVAVIARVPFDEGTLTGNLTKESTWPEGDWRNTYFVTENLEASVDRAEALRPLVPDEMSMAEFALRFVLSCDDVATVIPGMRKLHHVKENLATTNAGALADDMIEALREHRWDRKPTDWSQ